mgnify:CR=1 FL=1
MPADDEELWRELGALRRRVAEQEEQIDRQVSSAAARCGVAHCALGCAVLRQWRLAWPDEQVLDGWDIPT